jgi:hypothetical protein
LVAESAKRQLLRVVSRTLQLDNHGQDIDCAARIHHPAGLGILRKSDERDFPERNPNLLIQAAAEIKKARNERGRTLL